MGKSIKGTQTEKNLLTSFAGESQARMRYTYFASVAKKEGYEQIAAIFTETADQEKEHAKRMFKWLEGGMVEITASYPAGIISTTAENLKAAAAGENEEWTADYPHFADVADEEGFPAIAAMYRNIAIAERHTKKDTWLSWQTLKTNRYSRRKKRPYGNAATVVSYTKAKKLRRLVRHVSIHKLTSK